MIMNLHVHVPQESQGAVHCHLRKQNTDFILQRDLWLKLCKFFCIPTYIWQSEKNQKIWKYQKKTEIWQLTDLQCYDGLQYSKSKLENQKHTPHFTLSAWWFFYTNISLSSTQFYPK